MDGFSSKFSHPYRCLEHIKGYYLIPRLRKYLLFVIITRIILMLYKFIFSLPKKFKYRHTPLMARVSVGGSTIP